MSMTIRKGDKVQVISGKDRGKQGVVLAAYPSERKVVVEGVAVVKKAQRPTQENQAGGFITKEAKIDVSNVMLVDPSTGEPTRVSRKRDGKKLVRVSKKTGTEF